MRLRSALACLAALAALLSAFAGAWGAAATPAEVTSRLAASLEAGDARQAWSLIRVEGAPGGSSFLTERDLARALEAAPGHRELVGGAVHNLAPAWDPAPYLQVVVRARKVLVRLPQGYLAMQLDGRALALQAGQGHFEVLPVWHRLTLWGGAMVESYSEEVAPSGVWAPQIRLSPAGSRRLADLVTAALSACSLTPIAAPVGCPQAALIPGGATGLAWHLLNPAPPLTIVSGGRGSLQVEGSFSMVLSYRLPFSPTSLRAASTGTFAAPLQVSFGSLQLGPITAIGAP